MTDNSYLWNTGIPLPDPLFEGTVSLDVPIVLDLGSYKTRAGFANQTNPHLDYVSYYGRYRPTNEQGQNEDSMIGAGNDLYWVPQLARKNTYFDGNIAYHQDGLEYILDHAFGHLLTKNNVPSESLPTSKRRKHKGEYVGSHMESPYDGSIRHPVIFTEAPLIPLYSKNLISQLLFECYTAPSICSGIDSCFSLYYDHYNMYKNTSIMNDYNEPSTFLADPMKNVESIDEMSSLVISSGNVFSHLLPIVEGNFDAKNAMRLSVGGSQASEFLTRILQLRYPQHKALYIPEAITKLKEDHCYISKDYLSDIDLCLEDRSKFAHKIQLPYEVKTAPVISEEEKQKRERRRQENAQRMRDLSRRKQIEKFKEKQLRLDGLKDLLAKKDDNNTNFTSALSEAGFDKESSLLKEMSDIEKYLEKAKEKIDSYDKETPETPVESKETEEQYLKQLLIQRDQVYQRIESRKKEKVSNSGRQSRATKNRMKLIAQAADDTLKDDEFGKKVSDWDVYLDIAIKNNSEDVHTQDEALLGQLDREIASIQGTIEPVNNDIILDVERIRVPEIIFQPSIIGVDQPGLGEAVHISLRRQKEDISEKLLNRVYLSGGNMGYKNMLSRVYSTIAQEVSQELVLSKKLAVILASDTILGAWKGAALFASLDQNKKYFITRESYFEDGLERIFAKMKRHIASNPYIAKMN